MSKDDSSKKSVPNAIPGFDPEAIKKQFEQQMKAAQEQMKNFDMNAYLQAAADMMNGQLGEVFGTSEEIKLDPNSKLTPQQHWALAVGATLAQRNQQVLNAVPTGLDAIESQEVLANWWGIEDAQGARETIAWLQDGGQRIYFNQIVALEGKGLQGEELQKALAQHEKPLGVNPGTLRGYYTKYRAALRFLKKEGVLGMDESVRSIDSWDFGRLVNVGRWCVDAGYLAEKEFWEIVMPVARVTQKSHSSWRSLSSAYLVGRLFWNEDTDEMSVLIPSFHFLLSDPKSPYVTLPWDLPL